MQNPRAHLAFLLLLSCGCDRTPSGAAGLAPSPAAASASTAAPAASPAPSPAVIAPASAQGAALAAEVGKPAPALSLPNLDGQQVSLADFKGKIVVLEWFNPGCPFVRAAHTKGSLVDAAKRAQKAGVVWLAINSGAPGQQGHGIDANRKGVATFGLPHPVLLDEDGKVGRSYGAQRTPHLFVIDPAGTLVYAGAVDNSPDGEGEAPEGGTVVRYVDQALGELAAGKPVSVASTKAYGCGVKYGK